MKILDLDSPWFWIACAAVTAAIVVAACIAVGASNESSVDDTTLMLITVPQ